MQIDPAIIGFDIDGVVADITEAFTRMAAWHGVRVQPHEITQFEVENCLEMDRSLIDSIFMRLMKDPMLERMRPMRYAVPTLRELASRAPLSFVTARPYKRPISLWLKSVLGDHAFKKTRLIATGDHDDKAKHIKELGLRFFVDDRVQTCDTLSKEGIMPIVFQQPWNQGQHTFSSVDNWLTIRKFCQGR